MDAPHHTPRRRRAHRTYAVEMGVYIGDRQVPITLDEYRQLVTNSWGWEAATYACSEIVLADRLRFVSANLPAYVSPGTTYSDALVLLADRAAACLCIEEAPRHRTPRDVQRYIDVWIRHTTPETRWRRRMTPAEGRAAR